MAKLNLLKIVQHTLGAMESNNVNSIGDTIESAEVARIAEEVYFELMAYGEWPHLDQMQSLESVSDVEKPNFLRIPDNVSLIKQLKYNGEDVLYMEPVKFVDMVQKRNNEMDNITELSGFNGVQLNIINDSKPRYWTSFDEEYIVFDSYDSAENTTVVGTRSTIYAKVVPAWLTQDTFVPDMPMEMFPTYLARVKAASFLQLKREMSPKDEREAIAGLGRLRRQVSKISGKNNRKSYGRHSSNSRRSNSLPN